MLTQLEEKILDFVAGYIAEHGFSPTLTEIGEEMGIKSRGTLHRYLGSLVSKGFLKRKGRGWRNLYLSKKLNRSLNILPVLGKIEAGKPIKPIAKQSQFNFSNKFLGPNRFVLKVVGDTMVEAGIHDGDMVILKKTETARDDEIILALIDGGEAMLRRLRSHGDRIELIPANRNLVSLIYPTERVHIQGVLTGQFRMY